MIVRAQTPKGLSVGRPSGRTGNGRAATAPGTKLGSKRAQPDSEAGTMGLVDDFNANTNTGPVQLLTHSQDDDRKESQEEEGAKEEKSRETAERFEEP